jgi:hypothetical protein
MQQTSKIKANDKTCTNSGIHPPSNNLSKDGKSANLADHRESYKI